MPQMSRAIELRRTVPAWTTLVIIVLPKAELEFSFKYFMVDLDYLVIWKAMTGLFVQSGPTLHLHARPVDTNCSRAQLTRPSLKL